MKSRVMKYSLTVLAFIMMCCIAPRDVKAEEHNSHCIPTEEQIQAYQKEGTWEQRQEYVKKLNHASPSEELIYQAIQREYGMVTYAAGDDIPDNWKCMQVTGDAKMLLVRVEFADVKFEDSRIYSEEDFLNLVMGNDSTGIFPYESLNAYYKRSSYGKLNITSDQVYSCTLSKNRDEYEWEDSGEQELIKEVLDMLDDTVDFSDYDANGDGRLDSICINFAGDNSGWGSTWWSHKYDFLDSSVTYDGVTPAGYIFLETYSSEDSYGTQTLIHETGHLLGLPDYYSRYGEGIRTTDMMNNNSGDHNGFSKWLLGWIEEENILRLTSENGDTEVSLAPLSSETPGSDKLIAVIAPEDTSIYSEYFVVQYDEYLGNQTVYELENPAYRIFHVDAHLDEDGTDFQYNNLYAYERSFIQAVAIIEGENEASRVYYTEGDALTPDTNESSSFYGGNILGYTGIELTDFRTGEESSFRLSFKEKEAVDGTLELQVLGDAPLNMMEVTLLSNKPLSDAETYQQAYLEDSEGNQYPLDMRFENGSRQIKMSYLMIMDSLKPETEYTIVIPEGVFQIDKDVYSEECRVAVKTGVFPVVEAGYTYDPNSVTDLFTLDDERSSFLQMIDYTAEEWHMKLHIFEETEEVDVIDVNIPIPESYTEIMQMKGITCYDGTIAVEIRSGSPIDYSSISSYYKIDQSGNVLAEPFSTTEKLSVFPIGNGLKGTPESSEAVGTPELDNDMKMEIYTIDFENEITSRLVNMQKYMSETYPLDEDSYLVIQDSEQGYTANIFSKNDELIKSIDLSAYIDNVVCTAVKAEDYLAVLQSEYTEDDEYAISVSLFDMDGTQIKTQEVIRSQEWKDISGWKMEKTSWGYSLYINTSDQQYIICFLNEDLELISSMQVPNTLCDGTHMGNRCIVKWYDLTTWGYSVAITEPLVEEEQEVTPEPTPEITPEPTPTPEVTPDVTPEPTPGSDKTDDGKDDVVTVTPKSENSSGNKTENGTNVNTGDGSHLELLFLVMFVGAGVMIGCVKKHWREKSINVIGRKK